MAERATADRVAADMKPPNFRGAVQTLRTIKAKKDRISGINGEISGIYDKVEGYKVNKKGARIFLVLDALEPDERADVWRTVLGLSEVAEWDKGDLVDQAEGGGGNVVPAQFGKRTAPAEGENEQGVDASLDTEMGEVEAMPPEQPPADEPAGAKPKPLSPAEARARVKEHFGEGKAPPPSGTPAPGEPYAGDDSDLAGDDDKGGE